MTLRPNDQRTIKALVEPEETEFTVSKQISVVTDEDGHPDHTFAVEVSFPRPRKPGNVGLTATAAPGRHRSLERPGLRIYPRSSAVAPGFAPVGRSRLGMLGLSRLYNKR
jgi:hypothetical protein